MALLVWAPLPLASNRVWAVGVLAMAFSALLLLVCVNDYLRGHDALSRLKRAWLPILVLVLFLGLLLLQRLDLRPGVAGFTSVDPHHTLLYALMTATYLCAFVLVLLLVNTGSRIRTLAMVLVLSGVLQAIVSILMHAGRVKYSLFFFEIDHSAYAIGTFSYRNSLANYLMICISVGIGLLVAKMGAPGSRVDAAGHGDCAGAHPFTWRQCQPVAGTGADWRAAVVFHWTSASQWVVDCGQHSGY